MGSKQERSPAMKTVIWNGKPKTGNMKVPSLLIAMPFLKRNIHKERFIDIIKNFICFSKEESGAAEDFSRLSPIFFCCEESSRTN